MSKYASDRTDRPVPGLDPTSYTVESARQASSNCGVCDGDGLALIYSPSYRGEPVEMDASDLSRPPRQVLLRTVAYCLCPAGRKIQSLHQQKSKDVYAKIPDFHDVAAGKYSQWQCDKPADLKDFDPETIDHVGLRRLLAARMDAKL